MISQLNGFPHFFVFVFIIFFLIVTCTLSVIYVWEDNDSNV